jgi:hypothetical protein
VRFMTELRLNNALQAKMKQNQQALENPHAKLTIVFLNLIINR